MGIVADTSVLIAVERGRLNFQTLLDAHPDDNWYFTAVTVSELLQGVEMCDPARRQARSETVESILAGFPLLEFGLATARVHARLSAELRRSGRSVGLMDLLIASSAIEHDFELYTLDARSFPFIPGLRCTVVTR